VLIADGAEGALTSYGSTFAILDGMDTTFFAFDPGSLEIGVVVGFLLCLVLYAFFIHPLLRRGVEKELRDRKDQFISLASHYLLNPITIIQTAVSSLQEGDTSLTAEQRGNYYEAIVRGQQRLWIVTQQLVLVGEIDQKNLTLNLGVGNLMDTVSAAVTAVDPFARAKGLKMTITDDSHEVKEARFDERRLKQALIALADNAVKFSLDGGEVKVNIKQERGIFSVMIVDNGIGMPDEVIAHASEEFYRGTSMYTFDYEGLGLGLHIAQAIARLHQGNITFTSRQKKGTTAVFEFPSL